MWINFLNEGLDKILKNYLTEDIAAIKKYFPDIDDVTLNKLIALDPTFKPGSNSAGTYGKWILKIYSKTKNVPDNITEILANFDKAKRFLPVDKRNIDTYHSVNELSDMLNTTEQTISKSQQNKMIRKEIRGSNLVKDTDYFGRFGDFDIYSPETYAASCKLGQGTTWCTASNSSDSNYKDYTSQGKLYILINYKNPQEKYQIHFETNSFMNKKDIPVSLNQISELLKKYPSLYTGFFSKFVSDPKTASSDVIYNIKTAMDLNKMTQRLAQLPLTKEAENCILTSGKYKLLFPKTSLDILKLALNLGFSMSTLFNCFSDYLYELYKPENYSRLNTSVCFIVNTANRSDNVLFRRAGGRIYTTFESKPAGMTDVKKRYDIFKEAPNLYHGIVSEFDLSNRRDNDVPEIAYLLLSKQDKNITQKDIKYITSLITDIEQTKYHDAAETREIYVLNSSEAILFSCHTRENALYSFDAVYILYPYKDAIEKMRNIVKNNKDLAMDLLSEHPEFQGDLKDFIAPLLRDKNPMLIQNFIQKDPRQRLHALERLDYHIVSKEGEKYIAVKGNLPSEHGHSDFYGPIVKYLRKI